MRGTMKSRRGVSAIVVALVVLLPLVCAQNETAPAAEPAPATPPGNASAAPAGNVSATPAGNVSATPAGNVSAPVGAVTPPPVQVVLDPPLNEQGGPGLVVCPGILVDYVINSLSFVPNPSGNVYAFDATIFFQNIGNVNLVNWRVSIGYQWNEQITRVVNLTLPTGAALPLLGNSTVFGAPSNYTTLLSAVNAAGDRSLYITQAQLVGTETGAVNTSQALPQYVRIIAPGVTCSPANIVSPTNQSNVLRSCCITGSAAAPGPSPVAAPAPLALVSAPQNVSQCPAGVVVDYAITTLDPIPGQAGAYQFASLVTLANNAASALQNWGLSFQFAQNQLISIVNGLSVAPGYRLPAPGSGTVFVPPNGSYVNTTAQAAGNSSLYTYLASFSGNEVGADNARDALPTALDIGVAGFACDPTNFSYPVNTTNVLRACCLPVAPPAALPACPGVTVEYTVDSLAPIPDPSNQAYRFNATVVVANVGSRVLPPWTLTFGFQNQEIIATTQNLVVPATTPLPAPGNSTVFGAPPSAPTLPNAALVAGDPSKYALRASIEGTEFGAATLRAALPSSINLVAPGVACSAANLTAATGTAASLRQCCIEVALPPAPAPLPAAPVCQGVQINYTVLSLTNIPDPTGLAYGFQSLLTVANTGTRDLQGYQVRMDWRNDEVISDVSNWDLGDQYLPRLGNMTVFISPASKPYLFTAVEAVGNRSIYTSSGTISGTERGAATLAAALPGGIVLQAPGYTCPDGNLSFPSALNNSAVQCCTEIPLPPAPAPAPLPFSSQNYTGVLINWDIVNANASTYLVQIRVTNQNRYTTINGGWSVGWIWQNNEFIWSVVNGYVGSFGDCSTHPAVNDYPDFGVQVSNSQGSCSTTPSLIQNTDQKGILTGQGINIQNSTANFTVLAGKPARQFAISTIIVPQNFSIGLPGWACNPPLKVAGRNVPFGTISGQVIPAYASYNITCGPTQPNATLPKCCVSMSAFFNQTVAPCKSCACGNCPGKGEPPLAPVPSGTGLVPAPGTCNFNSSSLPTVASQVAIGVAQAGRVYPTPLAGRCEDGCPSNIHFDISGAGDGGWNVKIVAANRLPVSVPDWLLVMELPELNYLQSVFSVDWRRDAGASRPTMLFYGVQGYNDVVLPAGNVEWILAFNFTGNSSLRGTLGGTGVRPLAEANSNSFPTRIWFNGDECEMPPRDTWPISLAQYNNLTRVAPAVRLVISRRHVVLLSGLALLLAIFLS